MKFTEIPYDILKSFFLDSPGMSVPAPAEPITPFTILSSITGEGNIIPLGIVTVDAGGTQSYTFIPSAGYYIGEVLVDGDTKITGIGGTYTFTNVQANHTISVAFSAAVPITYTITSSLYESIPFIETFETSPGYDNIWDPIEGEGILPPDPDAPIPTVSSGKINYEITNWGNECIRFEGIQDEYGGVGGRVSLASIELKQQVYLHAEWVADKDFLGSGDFGIAVLGDDGSLDSFYPPGAWIGAPILGTIVNLDVWDGQEIINIHGNYIHGEKHSLDMWYDVVTGDYRAWIDGGLVWSGIAESSTLLTGYTRKISIGGRDVWSDNIVVHDKIPSYLTTLNTLPFMETFSGTELPWWNSGNRWDHTIGKKPNYHDTVPIGISDWGSQCMSFISTGFVPDETYINFTPSQEIFCSFDFYVDNNELLQYLTCGMSDSLLAEYTPIRIDVSIAGNASQGTLYVKFANSTSYDITLTIDRLTKYTVAVYWNDFIGTFELWLNGVSQYSGVIADYTPTYIPVQYFGFYGFRTFVNNIFIDNSVPDTIEFTHTSQPYPPLVDPPSSTAFGGTITPLGNTDVIEHGWCYFEIIPFDDCSIIDVIVDGVPQGAMSTYVFSNVIADHTIEAYFSEAPIYWEDWIGTTITETHPWTSSGFYGGADPPSVSSSVLTLSAAATDGDHDLTYESINDTPANRPTTLIFTYKATVTIIQESALTDKNYYQDDNILISIWDSNYTQVYFYPYAHSETNPYGGEVYFDHCDGGKITHNLSSYGLIDVAGITVEVNKIYESGGEMKFELEYINFEEPEES